MKENAVIMLRSCRRDRDKLPNGKRCFDQLAAGKAGKLPAQLEGSSLPGSKPWRIACQLASPGSRLARFEALAGSARFEALAAPCPDPPGARPWQRPSSRPPGLWPWPVACGGKPH